MKIYASACSAHPARCTVEALSPGCLSAPCPMLQGANTSIGTAGTGKLHREVLCLISASQDLNSRLQKRCFTSLKLLAEFSILASTLWGASISAVFWSSCNGCPWYGIAALRPQGACLMSAFSDGDSESCSFSGCCGTVEPAFLISQSKNVHGRVHSISPLKLKNISVLLGWWVWMLQSCRRGDTRFKCSSRKSWSGFYYTFLQSSEQIKW